MSNQNIDLFGSNELSKSNISTLAIKLIEPFENGEKTAIEMDMQLKFVEETIKKSREQINSFVLASIFAKGFEINGCKVSQKQGYAQLNYEDDLEYLRIKNLLAERKQQLDSAFKSTHNIVTDEGEVIPKVSVKNYTKDSVSYTFKK
jgi:hypothetical protein